MQRSIVSPSKRYLKSSDAARQLGVSAKALRLYEQRGLVTPDRTAAGWRSYGPEDMVRAAEIVALRAFGLSLSEIERVLSGDPRDLEPALGAHQAALESRLREIGGAVGRVRELRADLLQGKAPEMAELSGLIGPQDVPTIGFDLPWPWGGERFELRTKARLTYIIGPLGSGKTKLAMRLAEALEDAEFVDLTRLEDDGVVAQARLSADATLRKRVDAALGWLIEDDATVSPALEALLVGLLGSGAKTVVVDMVEDGLDHATQQAVIAYLRRASNLPKLFLMTRSSAILDLAAMPSDEAILFCPANHSPPTLVVPYPGAPGFEAVASCLASPEVRARTAGVVVRHVVF
ncbi:MerR family transcriptional regulator [Devosia neptuniae]|jgi:DNA-binding transcriptional MerR regulator|uniref:MerR family transcriptional regulator n=1 Tax=Devosia TaxID=46913 RepID=UPI0022AF2461|nr:MerR family transcriptional regulator [Devosia neptuniae]MCZ4346601.1 MerR family transcriptional regulator [Devosia neptuniae]|tara:strand:- start:7841 stop:8884 length:1044 start_codon:yes stop_codon:yes gene_type:complete